jgi:hypothetical protein
MSSLKNFASIVRRDGWLKRAEAQSYDFALDRLVVESARRLRLVLPPYSGRRTARFFFSTIN